MNIIGVLFSLGKNLLPCFKSFRVALVLFFLLKSAVILQRNFHDVSGISTCRLFYSTTDSEKAILKRRGFKPKFLVN
jgi:hypothetical protein